MKPRLGDMTRDSRLSQATFAKYGTPIKRMFWDYEERSRDVCSRPMTSEERMWAMALVKTIQDYKGVSTDGNKECVECHQAEHPGCFHEYTRGGEPYVLRTNKQCRDFHTYQQCAAAWISSDAPDIGNDRTGQTFLGLCELLNIEPTYLRRRLQSGASDSYWQDEAKIHAFLGFHTGHENKIGEEAFVHAGCPGEEGESD